MLIEENLKNTGHYNLKTYPESQLPEIIIANVLVHFFPVFFHHGEGMRRIFKNLLIKSPQWGVYLD